jgi:hypothetical protein
MLGEKLFNRLVIVEQYCTSAHLTRIEGIPAQYVTSCTHDHAFHSCPEAPTLTLEFMPPTHALQLMPFNSCPPTHALQIMPSVAVKSINLVNRDKFGKQATFNRHKFGKHNKFWQAINLVSTVNFSKKCYRRELNTVPSEHMLGAQTKPILG